MAISVIRNSLPGGDNCLNESDGEMVAAVASGLAQLEDSTPNKWKEAMASPDSAKWQAAADKEMAGCEKMGVWELVPRSSVPKHEIITCKWVFKIKTDSEWSSREVQGASHSERLPADLRGSTISETLLQRASTRA